VVIVVVLPKGTLVVIRETLLAAQGSLAVATSHVQLAKMRCQRDVDRPTRDYLDTSGVFIDNATLVLLSIHEMLHRYEQALNEEAVQYAGPEKRTLRKRA
jgi:hypothetical protein